jgi:hypothetical protein
VTWLNLNCSMFGRIKSIVDSFAAANSKTRWLRRKVANRLARRPIAAAWREFADRLPGEQLINEAFDQRHGTDTATEIALAETGVSAENAINGNGIYRPLWEHEFRAALAALKMEFEGFTFVDIGSGKGKVLMMAADYPFDRIVGVEYSSVLHAIAQRNLEIFHSPRQHCTDLNSVHADACNYRLPPGPLVCLIFNSFSPSTLQKFVRNVEDDLASRDTAAYLLFSNLRHVDEMSDGLDEVRNLRRLARSSKLVILGNSAAGRQWQERSLSRQ